MKSKLTSGLFFMFDKIVRKKMASFGVGWPAPVGVLAASSDIWK